MSYLFPLFAILFWAGNVIVSKMAASAISPTAITFYRLLLALFLMPWSTSAATTPISTMASGTAPAAGDRR